MEVREIKEMISKVFTSFELKRSGEEIIEAIFKQENGGYVRFYHQEDCCEHVYLQDVNGDLEDLLNSPILKAEEVINREDDFGLADRRESFTWTFYKIATKHGYVTMRWLGESNGYYSESVDICCVEPGEKIDKFIKSAFTF